MSDDTQHLDERISRLEERLTERLRELDRKVNNQDDDILRTKNDVRDLERRLDRLER